MWKCTHEERTNKLLYVTPTPIIFTSAASGHGLKSKTVSKGSDQGALTDYLSEHALWT